MQKNQGAICAFGVAQITLFFARIELFGLLYEPGHLLHALVHAVRVCVAVCFVGKGRVSMAQDVRQGRNIRVILHPIR